MAERKTPILLVESETFSARRHRTILSRLAPTELAGETSQAAWMLGGGVRWLGVVVGPGMTRSEGLEVLSLARRYQGAVPALVITRGYDAGFLDRVAAMGATHLSAPARETDVQEFAQRSVERWLVEQAWVSGSLRRLVGAQDLSEREQRVLYGAVVGAARERVMSEMGITQNTYKTYVRTLLRKTDARNLDELALRVLRALLVIAPVGVSVVQGPGIVGPEHESA